MLLEVYVNGVLYSACGCFAVDDKDVQLEFEIADAIYDLTRSACQDVDVKLQVVTNDQVSISYCSPGEMRLQLEVNENDGISVWDVNDLLLEMNGRDGISELKNPTLVIYAEDLSKLGALVQVEKNRLIGEDMSYSCLFEIFLIVFYYVGFSGLKVLVFHILGHPGFKRVTPP